MPLLSIPISSMRIYERQKSVYCKVSDHVPFFFEGQSSLVLLLRGIDYGAFEVDL
jgi:hypothetical protein